MVLPDIIILDRYHCVFLSSQSAWQKLKDLMQTLPDKLYTAAQVREMDRRAIVDRGIAGIDLMRKAGAAVFEQIPDCGLHKNKLIVFCGAGNNAGDGYIIAHRALQADWAVIVVSMIDCTRLKNDARAAYKEYQSSGGEVVTWADYHTHDVNPGKTIIVDALLGTGLDREVAGEYGDAIDFINNLSTQVVAVDIPSGLNADSGQVMGRAVKADRTVTFIGLKQGLFTGDGPEYCGKVIFRSLQIPSDIATEGPYSARLLQDIPMPKRHRCAHKGDNGHVLLVGGDAGFSGAIRLAAEAALRTGAGLVSVATRSVHSAVINLGRPEIMSHAVEDVQSLQKLLEKASVVVLGPGLGQSDWSRTLFSRVLAANKQCVVDADGLNLLAEHPLKKSDWVLTPHPGEAARLLALSTKDVARDRFSAVRSLQQRYGGICLLKGAGTLIKGDQDLYISTTGNPGMATGGMGDVLAGMIGALLAQGFGHERAVRGAVYKHGLAADRLAVRQGERGLLASDLFPMIRNMVN